MKTLIQIFFSLGILFSGFSVICLGNNPVLAVVFLIVTFVLSAIYLILMGINFIGITYIILYVGAIAVLFLFIIMMLNLKEKDLIEPSSISIIFGTYSFIIVSFFVFIINSLNSVYCLIIKTNNTTDYLNFINEYYISNIIRNNEITKNILNILNNNSNQGLDLLGENYLNYKIFNLTQIDILGQDLYAYGAILLISLSIILLLAMFATIIISKPNATDPLNKKI